MFDFEDASKKSKEAMDTFAKNYANVAKGMQAIAAETAEYSRKSFEDGLAHFEKLTTVRSVESAVELQGAFVKASYEGFVAKATKISEMYADLAKDAYKPFEAPAAAVKTPAAAPKAAA